MTFKRALKREIGILKVAWPWIVLGVCWQYIHNVMHNMAYYLSGKLNVEGGPKETLQDLGFQAIPEINTENLSFRPHNGVLYAIFLLGFIFVLSPLYSRVPFTSIQVAWRTLMAVSIAVTLRCLTFIVTILPTPGPHCSPDATGQHSFDPPSDANEVFSHFDTENGCGDLIFSSHMMYALACTLMISDYSLRAVQDVRLDAGRVENQMSEKLTVIKTLALLAIPWLLCVALALLIVAQRSHYTVDVLVAWYTMPLVWIAFRSFFPWDICMNMRFWRDQPKVSYQLLEKTPSVESVADD